MKRLVTSISALLLLAGTTFAAGPGGVNRRSWRPFNRHGGGVNRRTYGGVNRKNYGKFSRSGGGVNRRRWQSGARTSNNGAYRISGRWSRPSASYKRYKDRNYSRPKASSLKAVTKRTPWGVSVSWKKVSSR